MDGLKLYASNDNELEGLLKTVKAFSDDIGMECWDVARKVETVNIRFWMEHSVTGKQFSDFAVYFLDFT